MQKLVTDSPNDILKEEANYFRQMFSFPSHPLPLNEDYGKEFFPNNLKNGKLTNVQKDQCECQITEEELFEAGKTPGLDGIPVEVYQVFFYILKAQLLDCFNYSCRNSSLSGTQQEGLISLSLKQDLDGKYKDPVYLKNWRPLTLQCCDAKILAKCIALRIKRVFTRYCSS